MASQNHHDYDGLDCYQLTAEDLSMLSEDLRNLLIPFQHVKITGDLGEGKCNTCTLEYPLYIVLLSRFCARFFIAGAFGMVYKGQLTIKGRKIDVAVKTVKSKLTADH